MNGQKVVKVFNHEEQIKKGNTTGMFTADATDYDFCDNLTADLENELGREIDFSVEQNDIGELPELLKIAKQNNDSYVVEIITALLENGFDYRVEE